MEMLGSWCPIGPLICWSWRFQRRKIETRKTRSCKSRLNRYPHWNQNAREKGGQFVVDKESRGEREREKVKITYSSIKMKNESYSRAVVTIFSLGYCALGTTIVSMRWLSWLPYYMTPRSWSSLGNDLSSDIWSASVSTRRIPPCKIRIRSAPDSGKTSTKSWRGSIWPLHWRGSVSPLKSEHTQPHQALSAWNRLAEERMLTTRRRHPSETGWTDRSSRMRLCRSRRIWKSQTDWDATARLFLDSNGRGRGLSRGAERTTDGATYWGERMSWRPCERGRRWLAKGCRRIVLTATRLSSGWYSRGLG